MGFNGLDELADELGKKLKGKDVPYELMEKVREEGYATDVCQKCCHCGVFYRTPDTDRWES
ncbi:MAG: hypothetical protein KJ879_01675 [Nanoarchaeota archaeon]|nr:hypothetical protein [Nanoarchaeota archaeon]